MNTYPALAPFAVATVVLCLNLLFLWGISGGTRAKTKTAMNEEDAALLANTKVVADHPPEVARVLRAHANATANIVPTLLLAWVYVVLGGPAQPAWILLGTFMVARWLHSLAYLAGKQPWRTIFFSVATLVSVAFLGYDGFLVSRML